MLIGRKEHATRDDFIGALALRLMVTDNVGFRALDYALAAMHEDGAKVYFQGWDYSPAESDLRWIIDREGNMFQKIFKRRAA